MSDAVMASLVGIPGVSKLLAYLDNSSCERKSPREVSSFVPSIKVMMGPFNVRSCDTMVLHHRCHESVSRQGH